jgi:hypothetical protein
MASSQIPLPVYYGLTGLFMGTRKIQPQENGGGWKN